MSTISQILSTMLRRLTGGRMPGPGTGTEASPKKLGAVRPKTLRRHQSVAVYMLDLRWQRVCDVCWYPTYDDARRAIEARIDGFIQACLYLNPSGHEVVKRYFERTHDFYIDDNGSRGYDGSTYFRQRHRELFPADDRSTRQQVGDDGASTLIHPIHRASYKTLPVPPSPSWSVPRVFPSASQAPRPLPKALRKGQPDR